MAGPSESRQLRRATYATLGLAAATLAGLALLFGVLLDPVPPRSCITGLYPGAYADAFVPAHTAAFVLLAAAVARLAAARSASGRPPAGALVALGALAVFVAAGLLWHELLAWPLLIGLVAAVPVGGGLLLAGVVRTVATARLTLDAAERWRRHARMAQAALWVALLLGLPALSASAWLNGAGLFCF